jgi:hypothetical protein
MCLKTLKPGDRFDVLDLVAFCKFKTSGSISFDLLRESVAYDFPSDGISVPFRPGFAFDVLGWVDVHHPCEEQIRTKLRVCVPAKYQGVEQLGELLQVICTALGIPLSQPYEACVIDANQQRMHVVRRT